MWLINAATLALEFFLPEQAPPYAILSHTWDDGEVSLAEFQRLDDQTKAKPGFRKIQKTCDLARSHRIAHVWIDTCCIDKTSSAELSEAINSMYSYYRHAKVCYAFLNDWDPYTSWQRLDSPRNTPPRWFLRGWTLQELIAPSNLRFYDSTWTFRGSKADKDVLPHLSSITAINQDILRDGSEDVLRGICLAQRMSWASCRETTRTEDIAYCLLGIFQINMPLLYGEGSRAFKRLQEEIIKNTTDLSILAWFTAPGERISGDILSSHPWQFRDHARTTTRTTMFSPPEAEMTMTTKALRIKLARIHTRVQGTLPDADGRALSNLVYLDTGCASTEEGGLYNTYFVALIPKEEPGGFPNMYSRVNSTRELIGRNDPTTQVLRGGSLFESVHADLQSIYVVRPRTRLIQNHLGGNLVVSHENGSEGDKRYYTKFKETWPPSLHTQDRGYGACSLRLHPYHPTMGYMVFELRTNTSTEPLVEFLVVFKHVARERDREELRVRFAMGKAADELRIQAAAIEKLEPWPAEDALREYLEICEESGCLVGKLEFLHGDHVVSWRLVPEYATWNTYAIRIW